MTNADRVRNMTDEDFVKLLIKKGFTQIAFTDHCPEKEEIEEAYVNLKVELSELDADIKMLSENASNKTLVVASPSLQYLTKYGFDVILIDDKSENERNVDKAYNSLKDGSDKIFILSGDKEPESLKKLKNETDAEVITINKLDNISDEDRDNKKTYTSLMKDNIELLRRGTE